MTCRDVPEVEWEKARERLIFYFSRGRGLDQARDLAQETLATLWEREDYTFEALENFIPVCLGFARNIAHAWYRKQARYSDAPLPENLPGTEAESALAVEQGILLAEVKKAARAVLRPDELSAILERSEGAGANEQNRQRVMRFRAVRKVAAALGLKLNKTKGEGR